jgi:hypothetical protein
MKLIAAIAIIATGLTLSANGAQTNATRFYVQLVRGTDSQTAPSAEAREIGPKLKERFGCVFKNKTFWETGRKEVLVTPDSPANVVVGPERTVRIDLSEGQRTVTAFYKGQLIGRTAAPHGDVITLIGDNRHDQSPCFIVVRRDQPSEQLAAHP